MLHIRKMIWIVGMSLTILVNIGGAVRRPLYKGIEYPVGPDVVSVYSFDGAPTQIPIPVKELNHSNGEHVETSQKVQVYLRHTYKDDIIVWYPHMTLCILGATIFLHFAMGLLIRFCIPNKAHLLKV